MNAPTGRTYEHLRSHARTSHASGAVTPCRTGRELRTMRRLRASALAQYPARYCLLTATFANVSRSQHCVHAVAQARVRLAARTESHEARARHRSTGVTHHGYRSKDSLEPVMRPAPLFALSRQCSPAVGASPIRQRAARCSQRRGLPSILLLMRAEPGPARP